MLIMYSKMLYIIVNIYINMGDTTNKKRIFYYDFLRCFAILSIIACHVFAGIVITKSLFGTGFWFYAVLLNSLRDIGVPLFVVISGALLLNRKQSLVEFAKKRFNRVVIPYLFWMVIFVLFVYSCAKMGIRFPADSTLSSIFFATFSLVPTGSGVFFWFVPMMITVYIIIFILNKINMYYPAILKIALAASIIFIILYNLLNLQIVKPMVYPFYAVFAILGYYLANTDFTIESLKLNENKLFHENRLTVIFFVLSLCLYLLQVSIIASNSIMVNRYVSVSQFSLLNVCIVCCIFLFARYFSLSVGWLKSIYYKIETSKLGVVITSISKTSYGIFLSHLMIYILLQYMLKSYLPQLGNMIYYNLILILTILISWGLIVILSKIPYLKKVSGAG